MSVVYRAVEWKPHGVWGIVGGWKTINSTMGLYRSKAEAEAAIRSMSVERKEVVVRKVARRSR